MASKKPTEPDGDECCGTTGPTTRPLDLQSDDATLPNQSSTTNGQNPKEDAMQKMIDDRLGGSKLDPIGGMKSDDTISRHWK